jgi:hypothetical protein
MEAAKTLFIFIFLHKALAPYSWTHNSALRKKRKTFKWSRLPAAFFISLANW